MCNRFLFGALVIYMIKIITLALLVGLTPLAIDMYIPAMLAIATDFSTDLSVIQNSLTTYFLGLCLGQLIYGPASDALGRKPVLLIGLLLFLIASILSAIATNETSFLLARFLQAIGGGASIVIVHGIITDQFKGAEAVRIRSIIVLIMTIAPMVSPLIGGNLLMLFGWRSIFVFLAVYALLITCFAMCFLAETQHQRKRFNVAHLLESYQDLLSEKMIWAWLVGLALNGGVIFGFIAGSAYIYLDLLAIAPHQFGWYFSANIAVMFIAASINSQASIRYGVINVMRVGQVIQSIGLLLLIAVWYFNVIKIISLVPLFAFVFGLNIMINPNATSMMLEQYKRRAGTAAALLGAVRYSFAALFTMLIALGTANGMGLGSTIWAMAVGGIGSSVMVYSIMIKLPHLKVIE